MSLIAHFTDAVTVDPLNDFQRNVQRVIGFFCNAWPRYILLQAKLIVCFGSNAIQNGHLKTHITTDMLT